MQPLRIGLAPLARTTFDMQLASEMTHTIRRTLTGAGMHILGPQEMITDAAQAHAAAQALSTDAVDLLLIFQATFADSTMIRALTDVVEAPVFLWAVPEEHTGARLRLNSFCGINLAGHALTLIGNKYDYTYSPPDDTQAIEKVRLRAQAGFVLRQFRTAQMGVVGEHPDGMDSCHLDDAFLKSKFGLQVQRIGLQEVFQRARAASPAEVAQARSLISHKLHNLDELDQKPLNGTLSVYRALRDIADERQLDGLAVRCWPEFFTDLGCAACGAMSMLTDEKTPCSCEADANGTVTQLMLQWLSGEQAFGSDVVSIDEDRQALILWHCGLAPLSMADPDVAPRGTIHSNRKVPLNMEFPLKPGEVTIARINRRPAPDSGSNGNAYRLVIGSGEMLSAPPAFSGTTGALRFQRPVRQIVDTIITEGLEHHISLTYGSYLPALTVIADLLDMPAVRL